MHYLADFDLDGDVCECGAPVDGHPPIPKPSSVTEGRGVGGEVHVFSREWRATGEAPVDSRRRYPVFVGPRGEGIQITRPARRARDGGGRPRGEGDARVIDAIRANPGASFADIAGVIGVSRQSIYNRIARMEREGSMPAEVIAWRDRRASL
ncbi:MAG TPA: AsnC family transcriptional regulator [Candidatus Limnocylindrales bacterium]|nr:AsnC family transcriptional regulator [Candidatus Limnocylindrales bacterium]